MWTTSQRRCFQRNSAIDFSNSTNLYFINKGAFGAASNTEDYPEKLVDINFSNCKLSTLEEHLLKWEIVEKLSISGNPFVCDCGLKWLITNPKLQHFVGSDLPRCAAPVELEGMPFNRVVDYVCGGPASGASAGEVFLLVLVLFGLSSTVLAVVFFASGQRRITNVFYRPELPQMGYKNLATRPDAEEEHVTLEDDFEPRPEAV
ncbi:hypothetical protein AAVH_13449 [Aphelenchoides avenae]|nr:hypothetical protein AAVH_13449 [Aphelenchus avenae]